MKNKKDNEAPFEIDVVELKGPPIESEWHPSQLKGEAERVAYLTLVECMGGLGACFGSKSGYRMDNPDNLVVFNANVIVEGLEKTWFGDIDLTFDEPKLKKAAEKIGRRVYVLYEMDARFENAKTPKLENAVYSTDGKADKLSDDLSFYYTRTKAGSIMRRKEQEPDKAV